MVKPIIDPPVNPKRPSRNTIHPVPPYKKGTPEIVRRQMFFDWCQAVQKVHRHMLPLGVEKRWWMLFKSEHPFTSRVSMEGIKNG